jgi:hypothetical protein
MQSYPLTDVGNAVKTLLACVPTDSNAPTLITAGGTGDNTKMTGQTIDRLGYDSAALCVGTYADLGADETCAIAAEIQESSNGSSWDSAEALYASTTASTGDAGTGSEEWAQKRTAINLRGRKRYVRVNVTLNLSRANTDTANFMAQMVLGGAEELPVAAQTA